MSKRPNNNEEEMGDITHHLERQDKTLNEILIVLRGSVSLGVDGVVHKLGEMGKSQEQMISDVAHLLRFKKEMRDLKIVDELYQLKQWRRDEEKNKGKLTISWVDGAKVVFQIIGLAGTVIGIFLGIKQIFDNQ